MCKCDPRIRTPYCGRPGCEWPKQEGSRNEEVISPEKKGELPAVIQRMLENQGFYIGSNPDDPSNGQAPFVSIMGKVFSMTIDEELDLSRFIEGHRIEGPFRSGDADIRRKECLAKLREAQKDDDVEAAHSAADEALCELLTALGYEDVVNEFAKVEKWYS